MKFKSLKISKEAIEYFVNHNFREVMILMVLFGAFLGIILSIFIFFGDNESGTSRSSQTVIKENKSDLEEKQFLLNDLFVYPSLSTFDVTNDYNDFFPLKEKMQPDINIITDEFNLFITDTLEEDCKFPFEKRRDR